MAIEETSSTNTEPSGGVVRPIYSERHMRCLIVSESELKQIGLANLGVTAFVGIGSALISFGFDIMKDTALEKPENATASQVADAVERICLGGGVVCFLVAGLIWLWRRDMIKTIRAESHTK